MSPCLIKEAKVEARVVRDGKDSMNRVSTVREKKRVENRLNSKEIRSNVLSSQTSLKLKRVLALV